MGSRRVGLVGLRWLAACLVAARCRGLLPFRAEGPFLEGVLADITLACSFAVRGEELGWMDYPFLAARRERRRVEDHRVLELQ